MKQSAKKHFVLTAGLVLCSLGASAQELREGYVDFGANTGSQEFHTLLGNWTPGSKISDDDNFFISRVKPRARFRNAATQVRTDITAENDKKLLAWVPVNNPTFNALPDGVFDSEVFSMWSYVTHWGDWTAPLGRIPGAFLDVAHKNGVPVSGVASIPWGTISSEYSTMLAGLAKSDVDKAAKFFNYYGIDGLGYNSEFSGGSSSSIVPKLRTFHVSLNKKMKENNPMFENVWYDGTNDYGQCTFDKGLAGHNSKNFGDFNSVCYSLFFNYNWNNTSLLSSSVDKAKSLKRDPLDLYAGINMQGGEPKYNSWTLLKNYPISIGLWGAHSYNMFWESRGELGSDPAVKQEAYLLRTERYFGGGSRNPVTTPAVADRQAYNAYNYSWHGMASFMTARSAMSWDLSEEPLVTYFNLGNGKFFNLNGVRQHSKSWYNVGIQDYLPTWRWWFASKLLGRTAADVPAAGLEANFTWDDAYFGGSTIRISGTNAADEYLHLFKTQYSLKKGDVITFKYKLASGSTDLDLVLSAVGSEGTGVSYNLCEKTQISDDEEWVEKKFTVGSDFDGKDLALVALHFKNAQNLDLLLGEFSIVRGTYAAPAKPNFESAKLLYNSKDGMDGKIIFSMPNNKAAGEPCYNIDVNASEYRLYAQQEGKDPILMSTTTSWGGLYYAIPVVGDVKSKVRLGVSAVSLDRKSESEIAWSKYMMPTNYKVNDDIELSKPSIKPGESFTIGYVDSEHPEGTFTIYDEAGKQVFTATGKTVEVKDGLKQVGSYTLKVNGTVYDAEGNASTKEREYFAYVQITDNRVGAVPEIYTLTANGKEEGVTVNVNENVQMAYTGRNADGLASQGVNLNEKRFGARCSDLGLVGAKSFSVTFWLKLNKLALGETQLLSVANKLDGWPKTDWGWIWSNIQEDGSIGSFTFRGTDNSSNDELRYKFGTSKIPVGAWAHIAYVFDYDASGKLHCDFYINGVKQKLTAWNRTSSPADKPNDPGYQKDVYHITDGQVLAIGGDAFGRNGIDGAVDNVMVWDGAITAEDVKKSMGDINAKSLPANVKAFWNFEQTAGDDNLFKAAGSLAGTAAGTHFYSAGDAEGQGTLVWEAPQYTSGCPFLADNAYKVETRPTWKANHGTINESTGNGSAGSAKISYVKGGDYTVTLKLANSLGSAQKTFSVIKVSASGIDAAEAGEIKTYTVGENAVVEFAEAGNYEVSVYTTAGVAQARKAAQLNAGNVMNIHLANTGIYVLTVKKDGKVVRTVKLVRK